MGEQGDNWLQWRLPEKELIISKARKGQNTDPAFTTYIVLLGNQIVDAKISLYRSSTANKYKGR